MTRSLAPRDSIWLTTAVALVGAPHAERLPWWMTAIVCALLVWRAYLAHSRRALPHRYLLIPTALAAASAVYLTYGTILGRDAGVALLVAMLALKLLEMRSTRDAMLLIFLSYFLVITNFLYSQTIPTALYMLACVWFITAGMIGIQHTRPAPSVAPQFRTAGMLILQSLPLMLIFFVLFPRLEGPLWALPGDASRGSTGLSDTMAPGSLSSLTLSEAVAFRATFKSRMPELRRLYWRGPVLWDFDGRTWRAPQLAFGKPSYAPRGEAIDYTVTVEAHGKPWLFAIDLPAMVPPRALATADFQIVAARPLTSRMRYDMSSYLDYTFGADESEEALARALALPKGFNPRTLAYAQELKRSVGSDRALMEAVFRMFNRDFVYTLTPPLLGLHTVDDFLFRTRTGFCEHYSSAFTVIMRAAGIPARVVTGYLGGEPNPFGNYLIVRQADAHAWSEVWLRGEGWVRVDPTAAVSPARVEQGISAMSADNSLPLFIRNDLPLLRELRLTWDSLANSWNQWVLGYTAERQRSLLTRAGLDDATWQKLAAALLTAVGTVMLVLTFFTLRRLRVRVRDPVRLAYNAFCAKLRQRGLARDAAEGPLAYANRISRARPDLEALVRGFIGVYVGVQYGGDSAPERVRELRRLAREFAP
jgi:transglutaminase-like putative cysteine protease